MRVKGQRSKVNAILAVMVTGGLGEGRWVGSGGQNCVGGNSKATDGGRG